ncbi:hypothetical protein LGL08_20205 [Clostridium estertheticum]|uniref:hypothetical protein n=1 Tax=Clostridium estertheticum TaxID=238834 RepID=UPI001CF3117E|nr:hypothetical protein [Clostridium estertheticum]MCB2309029.1 hypothetical protein [Clostridium estertheticum]MCB2346837.1 hypothetical protein [Clostridium estertheticum]MCB2351851.1 hypothetical protein [Clostridium estertheticum]WAG48454.1 hypothetical protein LL127_23010 [Clostridium estertheticum]
MTKNDEVKKKIKRSYYLTEECIKKLQIMKSDFPIGTSLESIVENAILTFYDKNHKL